MNRLLCFNFRLRKSKVSWWLVEKIFGYHYCKSFLYLLTGTSGRKRGRGPSTKLGGVSLNAKSLLACEKELEPLDIEIPSDPNDRNKWVLDVR